MRLDPQDRADAAMKKLHLGLLAVMEANLEGVRQDEDSEFLHDFRVSVRRTRAALTQVKGVFEPQMTRRFRKDFAWLGKITGPCRDLDVYLLEMGAYRRSLPGSTAADLVPLIDSLRAQKKAAHELLLVDLQSPRFRLLMKDWKRFLQEPPPPRPAAVSALEAIEKVAKVRLAHAHRRVINRGLRIDDGSPAEDLHKLRLDCKKLRYLLEFFRSLYEPEGVRFLIRHLKRLQDNLGDFNDLQVQQAALKGWAKQGKRSETIPAPTLLAMKRLRALLQRREAKKRSRFARAFDKFARPANRKRFERLMGAR